MPDGSPIALPSRARVEAAIQVLVDLLDELDAPTEDMEDDNEDACEAFDDWGGIDAGMSGTRGPGSGAGPGDPEDAEEGEPLELNGDEEDGSGTEDEWVSPGTAWHQIPPLNRFGQWEATDRPGTLLNRETAEIWEGAPF